MDRYVRDILTEAVYNGLEEGIIAGTGKDQPIGMIKKVGDDVEVSGGIYPDKETLQVTSLDPVTYGGLLAKLAVTPKGKNRIVQNVIMVVNPSDYFTKVMPGLRL